MDSAKGPHGYLPFTSSPPHKPSPHPLSCPSSCPANRPQPTPATLHSNNGPFGQKLLSMQDANHAESEEGERRETEQRKKKRVSRTVNICASHLLVLSCVSSEKLQALPGEPLIPVTFHKLRFLPHCWVQCAHLYGLLWGMQVVEGRLEFSSAVYFPTTSPLHREH